jgi:hypothetical protein
LILGMGGFDSVVCGEPVRIAGPWCLRLPPVRGLDATPSTGRRQGVTSGGGVETYPEDGERSGTAALRYLDRNPGRRAGCLSLVQLCDLCLRGPDPLIIPHPSFLALRAHPKSRLRVCREARVGTAAQAGLRGGPAGLLPLCRNHADSHVHQTARGHREDPDSPGPLARPIPCRVIRDLAPSAPEVTGVRPAPIHGRSVPPHSCP